MLYQHGTLLDIISAEVGVSKATLLFLFIKSNFFPSLLSGNKEIILHFHTYNRNLRGSYKDIPASDIPSLHTSHFLIIWMIFAISVISRSFFRIKFVL